MATPLISYLKVQKVSDKKVLSILENAVESIKLDLYGLENTPGIGASVRRSQLLMAQASINRKLEQMWLDIGDTVEAGRAAAAAAAVESMYPTTWMKKVMPSGDVDYMLRSAQAQAARGVDVMEARINLSKVPLSQSVYKNNLVSRGVVDDAINSALTAGLSAAELAKRVIGYVNPATPGGARYAAMRLGRTELNNAFHAQQVTEGIKTPWTNALKWNLSGSHPVPDECNTYADDTHFEGGGAGEFKPMEIPPKPHPNCLCYTTPVVDDREEFLRKLETGHYDDFLDQEFGLDPVSRFSPPSTTIRPNVTKPTPPKPKPTPAEPPVPEALKDLNRMEPQGYADAYKSANNHGSSAPAYNNNCHFVSNTMEMRARGFDVTAAPTYKAEGRYNHSIALDWYDPTTGNPGKFEYAVPRRNVLVKGDPFESQLSAVERVTESWPPDSRGLISGTWTGQGTGHIFNVYKDSTGKLHFIDGQVAKKDATTYLSRMEKVQVMRVDNLEPVAERLRICIENEIEKVTKATQATRLRNLIAQLDKDRWQPGSGSQAVTNQFYDLVSEAQKLGVSLDGL